MVADRVPLRGATASRRIIHAQERTGATTLSRCYRDVMGAEDLELGRIVGTPCTVDEDCFTVCDQIPLRTHEFLSGAYVKSGAPHASRGYCRLPTGDTWTLAVLRCFELRAGRMAVVMIGKELGLGYNMSLQMETVDAKVRSDPSYLADVCMGPLSRGRKTESDCLLPKVCNWDHDLDARRCTADIARWAESDMGCSLLGSFLDSKLNS